MFEFIKTNKLKGIGKIQYFSRLVGFSLATWMFYENQLAFGNLYEVKNLIFIGIVLLYPHLALLLYWRSNSNKKVEYFTLLIDATFAGICVVLMGFNFWPTIMMLTFTAAGAMVAKGIKHFINGLLSITVGMGIGLVVVMFDVVYQEHTGFRLLLALSVFFVLYTILFAFSANMSLVKVTKTRREMKKQKDEIECQHILIEKKKNEIVDSIYYAKRIQTAILPPIKTVKKYLNESFVVYKPKDVVAGDFYWLFDSPSGILFAAADCTGHGVPGAMVSVVCNNALNRSVKEYKLDTPSDILNKTREIVIEEFNTSDEQDETTRVVKDGMDIALCKLSGLELEYAGAHNPLWIVKKGENIITEIKANKQPIGKFDKDVSFTNHKVKLNFGDTLYIFSDGFSDQFGGEKNKKFKTVNFKKLLISIQDKSMEEQKELITKTFEDWKGNLDQLDDICIIGVRV